MILETLDRLFVGRLDRKYFALSLISAFAVYVPIMFIALHVQEELNNALWTSFVLLAFYLTFIVFTFNLQVRRLHDLGLDGMFMIGVLLIGAVTQWLAQQGSSEFYLAMLINAPIIYVFFLQKGNVGQNDYGLPHQHTSLKAALINRSDYEEN